MPFDLLLRRGTLVLDTGPTVADVGVSEGMIVEIGETIAGGAQETIDAEGLHVFPGVFDSHLHFNDPGRADWEGAATGSLALAAGGGTCYADMPLNASPPTLDAKSFDLKHETLSKTSLVDFALWGGLVPSNAGDMQDLAERGVIGFKAFMCSSGIDDFEFVDEDSLGRGMEIAARLGLPVAVHAEDDALTRQLAATAVAAGRTGVRDYLDSRPVQAELAAIARAIALAEQTGCSLHVVHVSSGGGAALVAEAAARGVDVTCETCPHYLVLTDEDVERLGAAAKCSPPIRDAGEQAALWSRLAAGDISFVASDHSPAPWSMKTGDDFFRIWGGIAGCQTTLGLLLAEGHRHRGVSLETITRWTAGAPAARYHLANKGQLAVGCDADFALVDLAMTPKLMEADLKYRHRISPYLGRTLGGAIRQTIVRGRTVYQDGRAVEPRAGQLVRPTRGMEA